MHNKFQSLVVDHFSELQDPRKPVNQLHRFTDILVITICAAICGADDWQSVELFGRSKEKWFSTFLELPNGIPSHDTFWRVFRSLDPEQFERCFIKWMSSLYELSEQEFELPSALLKSRITSSENELAAAFEDTHSLRTALSASIRIARRFSPLVLLGSGVGALLLVFLIIFWSHRAPEVPSPPAAEMPDTVNVLIKMSAPGGSLLINTFTVSIKSEPPGALILIDG